MDISQNSRPQPQPMRTSQEQTLPRLPHEKKPKKKLRGWLQLSELILLFAGTILVIALLFGIYEGGPSQSKYVDTSKFQAVFLNGGVTNGQVLYSTYFGHITAINNQFVVLQNVYYITTNSSGSTATTTSSNSNVQLTKLGCQQLHAPYDQMIINTNQIAFWENLQNSGQVVKAIDNYQKENPNGPDCSQSSSTSAAASAASTAATKP